jgi:Protein of unknown function DUF262/HNH endonuclease
MKCLSQPFTIGKLFVERNVIDENPPYQRESGLWSDEKQALFIDSVFNDFDVPKIYFHDIRGKHPTKHYAVVDGKQRLHAIWRFLANEYSTPTDFSVSDDLGHPPSPSGRVTFGSLDPYWQEIFKAKSVDVVLIQNADADDIEELFSRLNNGEPLTAAEKRNAIGGDMCDLVRGVAKDEFFTRYLAISNKRYQHYEISAKFLLIENTELDSGSSICDLKKRYLDKLVDDNRALSAAARQGLEKRVADNLRNLRRLFDKQDHLLNKQAYPPMYYLWAKLINREYAHPALYAKMKTFLQVFAATRVQNLQLPEDKRDPVLVEFGRLIQQGTNDIGSLESRVSILRRHFLQEHPDVTVRDKVRSFTDEERYAIWILGGKQCAECGVALPDLELMEADHHVQWAHGGPTSLENGRSLCEPCNRALGKQVA